MITLNLPKSKSGDFPSRCREIISDPLNLMISRVTDAGYLISDHVILHNGVRVKIQGEYSYYDKYGFIFASIPNVKPLLPNLRPLHRSEIEHSTNIELVNYIKYISQ